MEQLSGLDASFLYLETANAPMHIGGVSILDPAGRLDFDGFRRFVRSRLHTSRTFHQKLAELPLDLDRPYWVEDPDFDLHAHIQRTQLPEPGSWKELRALMSWEFAQPLDRRRPLWQLLWVEGVDALEGFPPGLVAVLGKVHHAAIDGVSGAELLGALFDVSPDPPPPAEAPPEPPPERPSKLDLLVESGKGLVASHALRDAVKQTVKTAVKLGATRLKRVEPPPFPFTAPRTPLNVPISAERSWAATLFELDRIKALRHEVEGATVNDVVLAICGGALRRYLSTRDELPDAPLIAMVPISVRAEDESGAMGNRVSAMLVSLATDEADPLRRLELIHRGAWRSKVYHQAIGARTLSDSTRFIPFAVAGLATRLYARMRLARGHRPAFNLVITNVPGPRVPLYVGGAPLMAHIGAAPVFDGLGVILPIFSYNGTLAIGTTACRAILPDAQHFADHLTAALEELEAARDRAA